MSMSEQRSEEWFAERAGKVTGSRVGDVMSRTNSGYGASRAAYMTELATQRLTGKMGQSYQSPAMLRGVELEPKARFVYEMVTGRDVELTGFVPSPTIDSFGASPDGLVGKHGLIEIKCPSSTTHVNFLLTGKIERKYILQMEAQMHVTGRRWCDFVSFDDSMHKKLQIKIVRYKRDLGLHKEMLLEVKKFLTELETMEMKLRNLIGDEDDGQ